MNTLKTSIFVTGLTLSSLAVGAWAQTGAMDNGAPTTATPPATTTTTMPDGAMAPEQTMPMSAQDMLFAARNAEGNLAEVTLATLALEKSKNAGVREVAQAIIQGHGMDQTDLLRIARAKGMTTPPMLSATHMAVYNALKKAKKDKFDAMYISGQLDDHENTIALYATQIANGQDADLKAHATQFLPDVVGHTIMIYNVARMVKAPGIEVRPMMPPIPPGVTPTMMGKPMDMTMMGGAAPMTGGTTPTDNMAGSTMAPGTPMNGTVGGDTNVPATGGDANVPATDVPATGGTTTDGTTPTQGGTTGGGATGGGTMGQ